MEGACHLSTGLSFASVVLSRPLRLWVNLRRCKFGGGGIGASIDCSRAPTSGGQYHWVSLLATGKWSVRASWITGWVSVLAWMAATATPAFLGATLLQGLFVLNDPTYDYHRFHGTLLYFAIIILAILVNIFLIKFLPYLETVILILHVGLFFALLVPLVYLAPQHSVAFVFTDFQSRGGWDSRGIAWCVGLLTTAFPFTGYDGACHMSEEIEHAETNVPRALITSVALNGVLGFGFLIALLFSMGDLEQALNSPTGFPLIEIFYQATQSKRATSAMVCGIVASAVAAVFALMASASRTTWAFSRDRGLPFSERLNRVNKQRAIPVNSILFTAAFLLCLGLINIGNTNAFLAIAGVATVALYFTYLMPIALLLARRLRGDKIRFGPWKLGRWGLAINIYSLCYTIFTSIFMFFPATIPVSPSNFNWTSVVFLSTLAISGVSWMAFGRSSFTGPIRETVRP
jgi:choline transport protein